MAQDNIPGRAYHDMPLNQVLCQVSSVVNANRRSRHSANNLFLAEIWTVRRHATILCRKGSSMRSIFYVFLFLPSALLFGQQSEDSNCDSAITQIEMTKCWKLQSQRADTLLYQTEQMYLSKIDDWMREARQEKDEKSQKIFEAERVAFIEAERTWIQSRTAFCNLVQIQNSGGSGMEMEVYYSRTLLTRERTNLLMSFVGMNR